MKTEEKIINAAYKVYYQDASASFDKIAQEAGVSRMTIHRKFPKREALIVAACNHIFAEGSRILEEAKQKAKLPLEQFELFVKNSAKERINYHFVYQFESLHESMGKEDCETFYGHLEKLFSKLQEENLIAPQMTEPWFFHLFDAVMMTAWHTYEHGCVAPNDIPELTWKSFLGAITQK